MVKLSTFMAPAQKVWNQAIQERVTVTSRVIGAMKETKMLGLIDSWLVGIQRLRVKELDFSKVYRRGIVYMNLLGNFPSHSADCMY